MSIADAYVLVKCPDCEFKTFMESTDLRLSTGNLFCPDDCGKMKMVARYEKVEEGERS